MQRARDYLEWHGARVVTGHCLISEDDSFMTRSEKIAACNLALHEEQDNYVWVRCEYVASNAGSYRESLCNIEDKVHRTFSSATVVTVVRGCYSFELTERDGFGTLIIPAVDDVESRKRRKQGAHILKIVDPQDVRSTLIRALEMMSDAELIEWCLFKRGLDSQFVQYHASALEYVMNLNRNVDTQAGITYRRLGHDESSSSRRLCVMASRPFGASLRSFYTDEDITVDEARSRADVRIKRVVVEIGCGECSRISDQRNSEDHDCLCIRVTIADGFTREETVRVVINVLKTCGNKVLLWFAIPCTGGCPFARMNEKKSHNAKQRLEGHLDAFTMLWGDAVFVMTEAKVYEYLTAFEWPTFCSYWQREEVWSHMTEMAYEFVDFHGCMFGLKSIARSTKDWPIKKPWSVATDCPSLRQALDRKCKGGYWHIDPDTGKKHPHASCSGVNTKMLEDYTDEVARAIHQGRRNHMRKSLL